MCFGTMTLQFPKLTPFQAELQQAHKLRQTKFSSAAGLRAARNKLVEINSRTPVWKTSSSWFDAHVRAYQFHLANRLVRPASCHGAHSRGDEGRAKRFSKGSPLSRQAIVRPSMAENSAFRPFVKIFPEFVLSSIKRRQPRF